MIFGKMKSLACRAGAGSFAGASRTGRARQALERLDGRTRDLLVAWYAKQQGWDKEAGLDLTMMPFDSGKNIVESLAAYDWAVAGAAPCPL